MPNSDMLCPKSPIGEISERVGSLISDGKRATDRFDRRQIKKNEHPTSMRNASKSLDQKPVDCDIRWPSLHGATSTALHLCKAAPLQIVTLQASLSAGQH
jgi:hypothetical protein